MPCNKRSSPKPMALGYPTAYVDTPSGSLRPLQGIFNVYLIKHTEVYACINKTDSFEIGHIFSYNIVNI